MLLIECNCNNLQLLVLADSSSQVKPLRAPLQLSAEQVQEAEQYAAVAATVKPAQQQSRHHKHIVLLNW
eukprot:17868-Heterococcus_DN1.PRE.2